MQIKKVKNIMMFLCFSLLFPINIYATNTPPSPPDCEFNSKIEDCINGVTSTIEQVIENYSEQELGLGGGSIDPTEKHADEVGQKPKGSVKCIADCPEPTPPPPDPFIGDDLGIDPQSFYEDCEDAYSAKYFEENGVDPTEEEIMNECKPKVEEVVEIALNDWGNKCHGYAEYRYLDMVFGVDLGSSYDFWQVDNKNGGLGLYAWNGEAFDNPIYLKGELEMVGAFPLLGDNLSKTTSQPIKYSPLGYQDTFTFENERFDYYIMNTDNPSARWEGKSMYGKYVLITKDKFGNDVEKTTNPDIKVVVNNKKDEQRGTLLTKRLRYADFTYTRSFEFFASWNLKFVDITGRYGKDIWAYAIRDSWYEWNGNSSVCFQDMTSRVGKNIVVGVYANTDGSISKNHCEFPFGFAINSYGDIGKKPSLDSADALYKSFIDIRDKKAEVDNAITYGDTTRGKIAIGTYPFGYEMEGLGFEYTPTGLEGEYLTDLKFGQWKWFEKQEGVLPNTFIIEVDMSTVSVTNTTPGTINTRYICMGQYHCDCEDINVLCSCEDEETGCNPAIACENGEDCSGPTADDDGGCNPSTQPDCNEYGEPTKPKYTPDGTQIPAGGPGGVTGKGSVDYYEKHLEGSSTLLN